VLVKGRKKETERRGGEKLIFSGAGGGGSAKGEETPEGQSWHAAKKDQRTRKIWSEFKKGGKRVPAHE